MSEESLKEQAVIRGVEDAPPRAMQVDYGVDGGESMIYDAKGMTITTPGMPEPDGYPLTIEADYWGRTPHLQILCREHNDAEGAPKVVVRYGHDGKVAEVVVDNVLLQRSEDGELLVSCRPMWQATDDTTWEIARDATPPCLEGDRLKCRSGLIGEVMRLRSRYDGVLETFLDYSDVYSIAGRLGYPDAQMAWNANPLTVGTVNPEDFEVVPELIAAP